MAPKKRRCSKTKSDAPKAKRRKKTIWHDSSGSECSSESIVITPTPKKKRQTPGSGSKKKPLDKQPVSERVTTTCVADPTDVIAPTKQSLFFEKSRPSQENNLANDLNKVNAGDVSNPKTDIGSQPQLCSRTRRVAYTRAAATIRELANYLKDDKGCSGQFSDYITDEDYNSTESERSTCDATIRIKISRSKGKSFRSNGKALDANSSIEKQYFEKPLAYHDRNTKIVDVYTNKQTIIAEHETTNRQTQDLDNDTGTYYCHNCGESSKDWIKIKAHMLEFHPQEIAVYHNRARNQYLYRCEQCNKNYPETSGLKRHINDYHKELKDQEAPFYYFVNADVSKVSEEPPTWKCNNCSTTRSSDFEIKKHYRNEHCRNCICIQCGEKFVCCRYLQSHVFYMHKPKCNANATPLPLNDGKTNQTSVKEKPENSTDFKCEMITPAILSNVQTQSSTFEFDKIEEENLEHLFPNLPYVEQTTGNNVEMQYMSMGYTYYCDKCKMLFQRENTLKHHLMRVHEETWSEKDYLYQFMYADISQISSHPTVWKCNKCAVTDHDIYKIKKHFKITHMKIFICSKCNKGFLTPSQLRRHVRTCKPHNQPPLLETFSGRFSKRYKRCYKVTSNVVQGFNTRDAILDWEGEKGSTYYQCGICRTFFKTFRKVASHMYDVHCLCLGMPYSEANAKVITRNGKKIFKCAFCKKTSKSMALITKHIQDTHVQKVVKKAAKVSKIFSKKFMEFKKTGFVHKIDALDHQYHCKICTFSCHLKPDIEKHFFECHKKSVQCDICNDWFKDKKSLQTHKQQTLKTLAYAMCKLCNKQCCTLKQFYSHLHRYHPEDRLAQKYFCNICKKDFLYKAGFKHHMKKKHLVNLDRKRLHKYAFGIFKLAGTKDLWGCRQCPNLSLMTYATAEEHVSANHSEPYKCVRCNLLFRCEKSLKEHSQTVHLQPIYPCNYCKRSYDSVIWLNLHTQAQTCRKKSNLLWTIRTRMPYFRQRKTSRPKSIKKPKISKSKIHDDIVLWKCPLCSFTSNDHVRTTNHTVKSHADMFMQEYQLENLNDEVVLINCKECNYEGFSSRLLIDHVVAKHRIVQTTKTNESIKEFFRKNKNPIMMALLYQDSIKLCGGNMPNFTNCHQPHKFLEQIKELRTCPQCNEGVNKLDQTGKILPLTSIIAHALTKHNPHGLTLEQLYLVDVTRNSTQCPICALPYENERSRSHHLRLHLSNPISVVAYQDCLKYRMKKFLNSSSNTTVEARAVFLQDLLHTTNRSTNCAYLTLYLPFRAETLLDVFENFKKVNRVAPFRIPIYLTKLKYSRESITMFKTHESFTMMQLRLNFFEDIEGINIEKSKRTNFSKYLILLALYLHNNTADYFLENVQLYKVGKKPFAVRLRRNIAWIQRGDIYDIFKLILDEAVTIFCQKEFHTGHCDGQNCVALVHDVDVERVDFERNCEDAPKILEYSFQKPKWGGFFRDIRTVPGDINRYVEDVWTRISLMKDELYDYAYVVLLNKEDTDEPQPSTDNALIKIGHNKIREIDAPYKLYAGYSQYEGFSYNPIESESSTTFKKLVEDGFEHFFMVYNVEMSQEHAEIVEGMFQLSGLYYNSLDHPIERQFCFINHQVEWSQLALGSYSIYVEFFEKLENGGFCFENDPEHVGHLSIMQKNIVISSGEKVPTHYPIELLANVVQNNQGEIQYEDDDFDRERDD